MPDINGPNSAAVHAGILTLLDANGVALNEDFLTRFKYGPGNESGKAFYIRPSVNTHLDEDLDRKGTDVLAFDRVVAMDVELGEEAQSWNSPDGFILVLAACGCLDDGIIIS